MTELRPDPRFVDSVTAEELAQQRLIDGLPDDAKIAAAKSLRRKASLWMALGFVTWSLTIALEYFVLAYSDNATFIGIIGIAACLIFWIIAAQNYAKATKHWANLNKVFAFLPAAITAPLVIGSLVFFLPHIIHVQSPGVGTCWANFNDQGYIPVACFSPAAELVTVGVVDNDSQCPTETTDYFDPTPTDPKTWCLVANH